MIAKELRDARWVMLVEVAYLVLLADCARTSKAL
jgi:hypothetical protein